MSDLHSKFLEVLSEDLVIGAARISQEGDFLWVNRTLEEILEYNYSELLEKRWQDLTHPEDLKADEAMIKILNKGLREQYSMSKRFLTKTGKVVWVSLYVSKVTEGERFLCFASQLVPMKVGPSSGYTQKTDPTKVPVPSLKKRLLAGSSIAGTILAATIWATLEILEKIKSVQGSM